MIATATELLKKYDVPGPRYTSYPTVLYWDRGPSAEEWVASLGAWLDEAEAGGCGAAVYVHSPFCHSLCTYCGCNSRITQNRSVGLPYVRTVLKEWELYRRRLGREKRIPLSSQRMDFENESPRTIASSRSGTTSRSARPGRSTPRKPSRSTRSSAPTPCFFANPAAAFSRSSSGGPLIHSSGVCSGRSSKRAACPPWRRLSSTRRGTWWRRSASRGPRSDWRRSGSRSCAR